jgi:hypothetical protein
VYDGINEALTDGSEMEVGCPKFVMLSGDSKKRAGS